MIISFFASCVFVFNNMIERITKDMEHFVKVKSFFVYLENCAKLKVSHDFRVRLFLL